MAKKRLAQTVHTKISSVQSWQASVTILQYIFITPVLRCLNVGCAQFKGRINTELSGYMSRNTTKVSQKGQQDSSTNLFIKSSTFNELKKTVASSAFKMKDNQSVFKKKAQYAVVISSTSSCLKAILVLTKKF